MRTISAFVLAALVVAAVPTSAQAQVLGTFRWKLEPYGSVLNLTLTQKGNLFEVEGFEFQCGGNLSLPVTGLIVPQTNGTFFIWPDVDQREWPGPAHPRLHDDGQ